MANSFGLSQRHQTILRATIQHYIATAEPVGSQTLAEEFPLKISSATIRNALGKLERAGLLYQPHVSAGRIPSDSGYRIYVDNLLAWDEQHVYRVKQQLQQTLHQETMGFELLLQRLGKILARLSGYISLITFPTTERVRLRHLQILSLSPEELLVVLVMDSYRSHSFRLDLPAAMSKKNGDDLQRELEILTNFLNHQLQGKSLRELKRFNWQALDKEFADYATLIERLQEALSPYFSQRTVMPFVVNGVADVIRQPEFSQLEQVQTLLSLVEQEQEQLAAVIFDADADNAAKPSPQAFPAEAVSSEAQPLLGKASPPVTLRIGSENPLAALQFYTLISATYHQNQEPVGSVSLLGPTRMLYGQVIPLVEQAAAYLSDALNRPSSMAC